MSMWRDQSNSKKDGLPAVPAGSSGESLAPGELRPAADPMFPATAPTTAAPPPATAARAGEPKESLIAGDITIEGKIEGSGHVRLAGRFKGDVNVKGDLSIERGAKLNGGVRANKVIIAGELEGNIESAAQVELLASGVLIGDVKAGTLTVAAGSRMRGQADFGWGDDAAPAKPRASAGDGAPNAP